MSCVVAIQFLHPTLFLLMRNERLVCVVRKILKRMKKEENQRATVVPFFFDMPCNSLMYKSFNTKQHQTSRRLTTAKSTRAFLCYSRVSLSACKKILESCCEMVNVAILWTQKTYIIIKSNPQHFLLVLFTFTCIFSSSSFSACCSPKNEIMVEFERGKYAYMVVNVQLLASHPIALVKRRKCVRWWWVLLSPINYFATSISSCCSSSRSENTEENEIREKKQVFRKVEWKRVRENKRETSTRPWTWLKMWISKIKWFTCKYIYIYTCNVYMYGMYHAYVKVYPKVFKLRYTTISYL